MRDVPAFLWDCVSNSAILTLLLLSAVGYGVVRLTHGWGVRPTLRIRLPRRTPPVRPLVDGHVPRRHVAPGQRSAGPRSW